MVPTAFVGADGRKWIKYNLPSSGSQPPSLPLLPPLLRQRREDWARSTMAAEAVPAVQVIEPSLSATVGDLVSVLLQEARRAEPFVTSLLQRLVLQLGGGTRLVDTRYKFKSGESLAHKLQRFAVRHHSNHPRMSRAEAEADIRRLHTSNPGRPPDPIVVDALRFTVLVPTATYTEAVSHVRWALTSTARLQLLDTKNFWHGEQLYRGINDVYSLPCPRNSPVREFFFEVQLHTPESIELKHTIHGLYQRCRAATDDLTREALETEMLRHANGLPIPCGVLELPAKVVRPPGWKLGIVKPTIS